jgi:hypothetical protein
MYVRILQVLIRLPVQPCRVEICLFAHVRKDFAGFHLFGCSALVCQSVFLLMYVRILQVFICVVVQPWLVQICLCAYVRKDFASFWFVCLFSLAVSKSAFLLMYVRILMICKCRPSACRALGRKRLAQLAARLAQLACWRGSGISSPNALGMVQSSFGPKKY